MKKGRYSKMALAAILGVAILQAGPALAKKKNIDEDKDLSVTEWGPWGTMGIPAAGPEQPPTTITLAATVIRDNPARINQDPVVTPVEEGPCTAGQPCGWTAEESYHYSYTAYEDGYGGGYSEYAEGAQALAGFEIPLLTLDPIGESDYGEGNVSAAAFNVSAPIFDHPEHQQFSSGTLSGYYDTNGYYYWYRSNSDLFNTLSADSQSISFWTNNYEENVNPDFDYSYHQTYLYGNKVTVPAWELDITVGYWGEYNYAYNYNDNSSYYYQDQTGNAHWGSYVYGTTTAQAALDNLNSGDFTIDYTGNSLRNGTPITASLNFGDKTWTMSANGGRDGSNISPVSSWGQPDNYTYAANNVYGQVGFNASGHIAGPNIITDSISATDGVIDMTKSTVTGAVFGNNAQALAGGYEIVKSVTEGDGVHYTNGQHSDVFVAIDNTLIQTPTPTAEY